MNIGWTTVANAGDAENMARELVEAHLAACVQIDGPITSFYRMDGHVENEQEYRVTVKFVSENTEKIEAWINDNHPYDIPQWLSISAERVNYSYRKWAESGVEQKTGHKPKKDVLRLSKLGRNYLRKRRFHEAENVFLEALELDSKNAYILVGLGDTTRELKKYEGSISYYEKVLEFDSVNVFALRGIGDAYRGILQHKKAIPYWLRYLECNKDDIYVMVRLAESFNKTGNFEKAEAFYLKALAVNPEDKYALLGLGSLYYKIEDDEKALQLFEKLLGLDGGYVAVLTMVGNIYRRRKEYETAAEYYEKATSIEEWNTFALYGLGDSHRGLGNLEKAVFWWSKILHNEPNNQDLLTRVGDAMMNMDRSAESLEHYMRSLQVGFDLYALLGMSRLHRNHGDWLDAERCCLEILEKVPAHQRSLTELIEIYKGMGNKDKVNEIQSIIDTLEQDG
nr:divalent cation tolerance protein CutA [Desulfobulbaceae bacterium]